MRAKLITIVLVLSGLLVNANVSYGCNTPPEAILKVLRQYVIAGRGVVLDGSGSHDVGGSIVKFEFNVDGDSSYDYWETSSFYPDGAFDGRTIYIYSSNGVYTVKLRVTDNGGLTDTDTCTVHVGPDSDNDDMPDEWENNYRFLVVGTDDAENDEDTDGYNNLCEYLHGTNPANPDSKPNGSSYNITIYVPTDASTIQRAINASINGDTIMVDEGTYTPVTSDGIDFHGKAITLRSTNPDNPSVVAATIIDCQGGHRGFYFGTSEGSNSVLSGFTIKNGFRNWGGGIYCNSASPKITKCIFINNKADNYGGGIYVAYNNASPTVANCVFIQNSAYYGGAIANYESSPPTTPTTIVNCVFTQNSASYGGAIANCQSSPIVTNCTIVQNDAYYGYGGGIQNESSSSPTITNCILWENSAGYGGSEVYNYDDPSNPSNPTFSYCDIKGQFNVSPQFGGSPSINGGYNINNNLNFIDVTNPAGLDGILTTLDDGLCLPACSPYSLCIDKGNDSAVPTGITTDIIGNPRKADGDHQITYPDTDYPTVDMGAYEIIPVWYVDIAKAGGDGKSWANAFKYLQDALNNTNLKAGDEIWVAKGLYKPGSTRSATFQLKIGVAIYGGFVGTETFRPQRDWLKNVTTLSGDIDGDGLLDNENSYNVVKGNNNATLDGFTITGGNANGSNPYDRGGGVYCSNTSPKISNCVITGSRANNYGGGIYCYNSSPVVTSCTIKNNASGYYGGGVANAGGISSFISCVFSENSAVSYGGGMYNCSNASPIILNCIFSQNGSPNINGGGMYNNNSSPTVTNCVFSKNSAKYCGGMYNYGSGSKPSLTNCTFSKNSATNGLGGGMYNYYSSSPTVTNCILWGDTVGTVISEIYNYSSNPTFSYCDIEGCRDSSGAWVPGFGTDLGGNIDQDPRFADSDNPAGTDGVFVTSDDGLRLKGDSPCIDAANGNIATDTDVLGNERLDIDFVPNTGTGDPDYTDIGAYEYDNSPGYTTSFETYQGYTGSGIDGIDGWQVEEGDPATAATICEAQYKYGPGDNDYYKYQRVRVLSNSTISHDTGDSCDKTFVRVNCIPSPGSFINIMNGSALVASIKFGEVVEGIHAYISVLDNGIYELTSHDYYGIEAQCRAFLTSPETYYNNPAYPYSYENTWIEFTIQFDWVNHSYKVSWKHWDLESPADIYPEARFSPAHQCYTKVEFKTDDTDYTYFELNRISISDMALGDDGGVVGPNGDAWLIAPEADILHPLKGRCIVAGPMWYDALGEYIVKCCPADLDSADPDNWVTVCSGKAVNRDAITLGYWHTEAFYNGDYFLKIEVYDDLGRKHDEKTITIERTFNGRPPETCKVKYPVIGRAKARTFHYEELPDLTINWPGTFPFEFKRMYNNGLRARIYPLFFGWTHNHNIRLIEDCQYDWIIKNEKPDRDADGLGVGRLWLCMPLGGEMFIGHVNTQNTQEVIYEPLNNENYRIVRTSSVDTSIPDKPVFTVEYVHYAPDGMTMTFNKVFTGPWAVPADEGLVDWMVVAGIDEQADRFGNKLVYEWSGLTEQDEQDIFLNKISAKVNDVVLPASLQFAYNFAPFGPDGPHLCSSITLDDGNPLTTDDANVEFSCWEKLNWPIPGTIIGYGAHISRDEEGPEHLLAYFHIMEQELMLIGVRPYPFSNDEYDVIITYATHNDDGTLLERTEDCLNIYTDEHAIIKQYDYEYDNEGNLITTIKVKFGYGVGVLLREEVVVTSPEGALLREDVRTSPVQLASGELFNPYNYCDWTPFYYYVEAFKHHGGGGEATDTEYYYENNDFPLKPTKIIEYFHDGDGQYDRSKTTTMKYDGRGNVIEQKVYVDLQNYVYTEYAYHQKYDFPIRQTTYQGYCHDAGETVVTSGARVEREWFYSDDPDDAFDHQISGNGNVGKYLVKESTLLVEIGGGQWADTFYTYVPDGQVKSKEDPEGSITYYEYDNYGFVSKEWQGATLGTNGLPEGNPQKRYYYDGLGRKILEADYLGKVQMNVCDDLGQVTQARQYFDATAITREDFEPDSYDERPLYDDYHNPPYKDDWWQTRTLYSDYDPWNKPWEVTLPTGGEIYYQYIRGGYPIFYHCFDPGQGDVGYYRAGDGRIANEERSFKADGDENVQIIYVYDSMFRLLHKYSYFEDDEIPYLYDYKYIKHEEYRYDASGNKTYEAVYSVEQNLDGTYKPAVLEKMNSYEYDILGRLTKEIVYSTEGGLNQTTEYGYDAIGNRIDVIDPAGKVIISDYDNANRKIREYFAKEPVLNGQGEIDFELTKTNAVKRKEVSYYANGKVKNVHSYDYDGSLLAYTEYTYDSRGRIWTVTEKIDDTQDAITTYDYSDDGGLERVPGDNIKIYHIVIQDAEGKGTGIRLSYHGKPEIIAYPSGDYEEYVYYSEPLVLNNPDAPCKNNGLLETKAVWEGVNKAYITYDYDDYGKVSKITYPDEGYVLYDYTSRILGDYGMVKQIIDHRNDDDRPGDVDSTFTFDYWYLTGKVKTYTDYQGYKVHYDYLRAYDQPTEVNVTNPNGGLIYQVKYAYDLAGRLIDVTEPLLPAGYQNIAGFDYDDNGNRDLLTYYRSGSETPTTSIDYDYNPDNLLTKFNTTGGPTFTFGGIYGPLGANWANIDGLGRLLNADETIGAVAHSYTLGYDMRSQLTSATITNIGGSNWTATYNYQENGDIDSKIIQGSQTGFTYVGNQMDTASGGDSFNLDWDLNGQMNNLPYSGITTQLVWNWDGKLQSATKGADSIALKYDPMGNRVFKGSAVNGNRKYVVDVSGGLPTILMEINPDNGDIMKTYIHANGEVLAQHDGAPATNNKYFYLHDRLGSVRQVIGTDGLVKNYYTYKPFGELFDTENAENVTNPFKFAGQYFDTEISEYYLRARQYDPQIYRFTSRDPVFDQLKEPLTLHRYLYCNNDPVNRVDLNGRSFWNIFGALSAGAAVHSAAIYTVATGVWYDQDYLIDWGIQMERLVAPAMLLGAALGPLLPELPGAALSVWEGMAGGISAGAKAISYWAMANPYEFISIVDVIAVAGGPPDYTPKTPAGWVTWFYMYTHYDDE
jgi:RHS repeat-associated protein